MIEKEFWVDSRGVSGSYLEQFGGFIGQLLLSKSAQTAQNQRAILLRHTDPSFSTLLSKKLGEEEQKLLKENASYVFYPIEARSNPKTNEVLLIGDRTIYVSGTSISSERVRYILSFSNQGPRLLLKGITLSEEEK
jgi:conjugal transfer pilus assembly protein TraE